MYICEIPKIPKILVQLAAVPVATSLSAKHASHVSPTGLIIPPPPPNSSGKPVTQWLHLDVYILENQMISSDQHAGFARQRLHSQLDRYTCRSWSCECCSIEGSTPGIYMPPSKLSVHHLLWLAYHPLARKALPPSSASIWNNAVTK